MKHFRFLINFIQVIDFDTLSGGALSINERNIEEVDSFTYLGVVVNAKKKTLKKKSNRKKSNCKKSNRKQLGVTGFTLLILLRSKTLHRNLKCMLFTTFITPMVTYGSETQCMPPSDESKFLVFVIKVLRIIFGAINERGKWRRRLNQELLELFEEPDTM